MQFLKDYADFFHHLKNNGTRGKKKIGKPTFQKQTQKTGKYITGI